MPIDLVLSLGLVGQGPKALWRRSQRFRSGAAGNAAVLVVGTAAGQLISIAGAPLLSRLYDSAAFGTYGVFMGSYGIAALLSSGQYHLAILVARDESEADGLLVVCGLVAVAVTLVAALAVAVAVPFLPVRLGRVAWLLVPAILVAGILQALTAWWTRRGDFRRVAASTIGRAVALLSMQAVAAFADAAGGLVLGQVASLAVVAYLLGGPASVRLHQSALTRRRIRIAARRWARFPFLVLPRALVHAFAQNGTFFVFIGVFGSAAGGLYWLAYRIIGLPGVVIGDAVRQVVWQRVGQSTPSEGRRTIVVTISSLGAVGIPLLGAAWFAAPGSFALAFGEIWRPAGEYASWLAIGLIAEFMSTPCEVGFLLAGRQGLHLWIEAASSVLKIGAVLIASHYGNDLDAVRALALTMALASIISVAASLHVTSARAPAGPGAPN